MFKKLLFEKTDNSLIQFFRSLIVGAIATVVDMGVLIVFKDIFHTPTWISTALGFIVGLFVNFLISSLWVFEKSKTVTNRSAEFLVFGFIGVIGLIINEVIVHFFEANVSDLNLFGLILKSYIIGKMVATLVAFVWNFCARKLLLYRNKKQ